VILQPPQVANCLTYVDILSIGADLVTDSIDTWTETNNGTGANTTQEKFQGSDTFKLDSGSGVSSNYTSIDKDIGSFGDRLVLSLTLHHETLGALGDQDYFFVGVKRSDSYLSVGYASDGLFVHDGSIFNEVGTDEVDIGVETEWTFDCDFSVPASATCDVYKNGILLASAVDCSRTGSYTEGEILIRQNGYATANLITYIKDIKIGDEFFWDQTSAEEAIQATYLSKSRFKLETNAGAGGGNVWANCNLGPLGDNVSATIALNHDAIGTLADQDFFQFQVQKTGVQLLAAFATDGLFIHDGSTWNEVGTDLVSQDTDQEWTFVCDFSTPSSATCDVYLNGALQAAGVDCSYTGSYTEGDIQLGHYGETTGSRITYVDRLIIGSGLKGIDSNRETYYDPCESLTGWTDTDSGTGATTQVTFNNKESFKLTSGGTPGAGNYAYQIRDVGTFGDRVVTTIKTHHTALGTLADNDQFSFLIYKAAVALSVKFATDGLFVSDGATQNEVGTNLVLLDTDQVWTFDCDFTTPSSFSG